MNFVVGLPVIDAVAARACVATMSREVVDHLVVIDQTDEGVGDLAGVIVRPAEHARPHYRPRRNLGVSRCMNLLAGMGETVVWVSTSMRFDADGGERLIEAADVTEYGVIGLPAALHAFAIHQAAFRAAGQWDENFFAYNEDTDWRRRLILATGDPHALRCVEVGGGQTRDGHGFDVLLAANPGRRVINFDAQKAYYRAKWGGCPPEEQETFTLPWGDRPIDWWEPATREELIDRYGLGLE